MSHNKQFKTKCQATSSSVPFAKSLYAKGRAVRVCLAGQVGLAAAGWLSAGSLLPSPNRKAGAFLLLDDTYDRPKTGIELHARSEARQGKQGIRAMEWYSRDSRRALSEV